MESLIKIVFFLKKKHLSAAKILTIANKSFVERESSIHTVFDDCQANPGEMNFFYFDD